MVLPIDIMYSQWNAEATLGHSQPRFLTVRVLS
jgi:hypothetical protein